MHERVPVTAVGRWVECWEGVGRLVRCVDRHKHEVERFAVRFGPHGIARAARYDLPIRRDHLANERRRKTRRVHLSTAVGA